MELDEEDVEFSKSFRMHDRMLEFLGNHVDTHYGMSFKKLLMGILIEWQEWFFDYFCDVDSHVTNSDHMKMINSTAFPVHLLFRQVKNELEYDLNREREDKTMYPPRVINLEAVKKRNEELESRVILFLLQTPLFTTALMRTYGIKKLPPLAYVSMKCDIKTAIMKVKNYFFRTVHLLEIRTTAILNRMVRALKVREGDVHLVVEEDYETYGELEAQDMESWNNTVIQLFSCMYFDGWHEPCTMEAAFGPLLVTAWFIVGFMGITDVANTIYLGEKLKNKS